MPYKNEEQRKAAKRQSAAKRRATNQVPQDPKIKTMDVGDRPTVEDAEAAYLSGIENNEAQLESRVMRRYGKSRTWACIMYQDSAPADWEDQLRKIGVSAAVSPLHDSDMTAGGIPKKAHWHVILDWPHGSTTYATAAGIARGLLHGTIPIPLVSPRGYYRYFCHLDNPNKAQYDKKDIVHINGFDPDDFLELTSLEKAELRDKLIDFAIDNRIDEYFVFVLAVRDAFGAAGMEYVCTNTIFWSNLLRSKRHLEKSQLPAAMPEQACQGGKQNLR